MRRHAVVAAGHPETCRVAEAILAEGGNAVDAALAALCAACVVEPALTSLGGGGFLMAHDPARPAEARSVLYDFFTQTPRRRRAEGEADCRAIEADFGPVRQRFHIGLGTIATPGAIKGLFAAHADLGRIPMRAVVAPAVERAREGVAVNAFQAHACGVIRAILEASAASRTLFASPTRAGALIGEGEILRLPELADSLEILAIEGEDLFYRGEMGQRLAGDCAAGGGHLTAEDLRGYRVERRRPLAIEALGATVLLNPPPASGGALIAFSLALFDALAAADHRPGTAERALALVEVMAATARARIEAAVAGEGDEPPGTALLHPELIARYRGEILGRPAATRGTTHISVIDADGAAASLSISNGEGSAYVLPGTGIMLNNMLGEDDVNPHGPQAWPEDRRLASMMAPSLAWSGEGTLIALGSGGSSRIRTAMLQVLIAILADGLPPGDAVAAPRLHFEDDALDIEPGLAEAVVAALARRWPRHRLWAEPSMYFGGVHAARRDRAGTVAGAGDARRGGAALVV